MNINKTLYLYHPLQLFKMSLVEKFLKSAATSLASATSLAKDANGSSDKKSSKSKSNESKPTNKKASKHKVSKPVVRSKKSNVRPNKKYKKHADSDDDDDEDDEDDDVSEDIEDTEDDDSDDDEYETEDDEEETDGSFETANTTPTETEEEEEEVKKRTLYKNGKKYNYNHKKDRYELVEEEEDEDDDEDEPELSKYKLQKIISEIFPSKYMNERVKTTKGGGDSKKSSKKSSNKKKQNKKRHIKEREEDADDEEDDEEDEDDEDDDDDEDYEEGDEIDIVNAAAPGIFNIMMTIDDENGLEPHEDDYVSEKENEKCDSDDEQKFMKEKYEAIQIPEDVKKGSKKDKNGGDKIDKKGDKIDKKGDKKGGDKKDKKGKKGDEYDTDAEKIVDDEYTELVDTKKQLIEQLNKKPNNKILRNAVEQCNTSIKKLVQKTRDKNARKYHKLIHSGKKTVNEIDYFKKNLSHKEQQRVMRDLTDINQIINVDKPYRLALLESTIPAKYKAIALQKMDTLRHMEPGDNEYFKLKNWVDTFMKIPFGRYKSLSFSIKDGIEVCNDFMEKSLETLDNCVYGLKDAKMQIMQMLGQWLSNPQSLGSAIAIHGPPGTGKTSIVKDGISKILGREFAFIPLGGNGDSSFLEGHSYTYEGSVCGKIVQILIHSKCMNPIIFFDELDKISDTAKGEEITGILTHLIDTSQNSEFHDKYFSEFDFDLSKCLFIFSYNDESRINPILKDRMYKIQTKGYESKDKVVIARKYLLPKIREQVGFKEDEVIISDEIIQYIVSNNGYTKQESGVRNLKRCLEIIHTKLNLFRLVRSGSKLFQQDIDLKSVEFPFTVTKQNVDVFIKAEENQIQSILSSMYV